MTGVSHRPWGYQPRARDPFRAASLGRRMLSTALLLLADLLLGLVSGAPSLGQPLVISDRSDDAVIRWTHYGGDGCIDPQIQRLPDLIEVRIGKFAPTVPHADRFEGAWNNSGGYVGLNLVFNGLVNPPGPLGLDGSAPVYAPFQYGPNPFFGFIEFDMDADEDTGGELAAPEFRYLGNVARFGGLPTEARFAGRVATDGAAFDGIVTSPPFVDRSGEEFHLAFLGEEIGSIDVEQESPGGDPAVFEAGETWIVEGKLLHRAHGFEDFSLMCFDAKGKYEASVKIQFKHDSATDTTTVILVYPLTNAAWAAFDSPSTPVDPNDGCADGQHSVEEALVDLQFSATIADTATRSLPEFQIIAGWEYKTPTNHLNPASWRISALVGTAYGVAQPDAALFIWTDVVPSPRTGDFNGDSVLDALDANALNDFITTNDGNPAYDDDGNGANGSIDWWNYASNFCLFDSDYNGFVSGTDAVILGDMDLSQAISLNDIDDFILALLDVDAYQASHGGVDPLLRGDINSDGYLNGGDIAGLVALLVAN